MKIPDVGRNLIQDTWTADGEVALSELSLCFHDNSCVSCGRTWCSGNACHPINEVTLRRTGLVLGWVLPAGR